MGECEINDLNSVKKKLHELAVLQTENTNKGNSKIYSVNKEHWFKKFPDIKREVIEEIKQIESLIANLDGPNSFVKSNFKNVLVPVVYDALYYIFVHSDENFRQNNFNDIKEYFYNCINNNGSFTKIAYEHQIKILLPVVKFDVCNDILQNTGREVRLKDLLDNLKLFFQYPRIHKEDVYVIIRNKLKSSRYKLISNELIQLTERNGHLGEYFSLKTDLEFGNKIEHFNFFVKFLFSEKEHLQKAIENGCSKKEEFFYMTYLPLLNEYGLGSLQNFAPQCYLSRENDLLVLDNLATAGYIGVTPNTNLDYHSLSLAISKLAHFHSSCIILEELWNRNDINSIQFREFYSEYLNEVVLIDSKDHFMAQSFDRSLDNVLYLLEKFPNLYGEFILIELQEKIKKGWKLMFERVKESKQFRNVICHGDMHVGNMLLKYDGNICEDIVLVDFQGLRYCPPVHDLLLFIYQIALKKLGIHT